MREAAERVLRLPAGFLPVLQRTLGHDRPPTEAAQLLRRVGYEAGEVFFAALDARLTRAQPVTPLRSVASDEFWNGFTGLFAELGWGALHLARIHPAVAALDSPDWVEAEGRREPHPACHLTTGLLADLLSRIAGSDVAVIEAECRAAADTRCRFLCGSPAALTALYDAMREGISHTEALERLA